MIFSLLWNKKKNVWHVFDLTSQWGPDKPWKKSNYLQEMIQGRNDMTGVDTTEFMILDELF